MQFTSQALLAVQTLAGVQGVRVDAVGPMIGAVPVGNGPQVYYYNPQVGGATQWPPGGTIVISDMSNQGLRNTVGQLCGELTGLVRNQGVFASASTQGPTASAFVQGPNVSVVQVPGPVVHVPGPVAQSAGSAAWWPPELGWPSTTGAQNQVSYAYFPSTRRLAVRLGREVRIYDAGDHAIGGVFQPQGADQSLTFTSQYGFVRLTDLPQVWPATPVLAPQLPPVQATPINGEQDIFAAIEKLAILREKNILSEDEFSTKKAELLSRL